MPEGDGAFVPPMHVGNFIDGAYYHAGIFHAYGQYAVKRLINFAGRNYGALLREFWGPDYGASNSSA